MFAVPMFVRKMLVRIRLGHYEYFTYVLYTILTSAYELLHTYFFQTNFIPYEHLLTNNCVQILCIQTISIRTLVLEST